MGARDFGDSVKNSTLPDGDGAAGEMTLSTVLTKFARSNRARSRDQAADADREFAQGKSLTILTRAASDMRRVAPARTSSSAARRARAKDASVQLPNETIRIALINRGRDDICEERSADLYSHHKNFAFRWKKTKISSTIIKNDRSEEAFAFDEEKCKADILERLTTALGLKANIICFGEFDYPPFDTLEDDKAFQRSVVRKIDGAGWPVFAVLGSFHRMLPLREDESGEDWTGPVAQNVARIALNAELRDPGARAVREVLKRTPASKAGELLTGFHGIDMEVFDTVIGKFAVVICSDAYDPSIVLEFFANSGHSEHKRDVILVPSYNKSAKLTHMCQVLSLTSRSIVVMVDACNSHTRVSGPFEKSSVWVCGVPVDETTTDALFDKHGVCQWTSEDEAMNGTVKILEVSLPALDNFVNHMDAVDPIPLFAGVRSRAWG